MHRLCCKKYFNNTPSPPVSVRNTLLWSFKGSYCPSLGPSSLSWQPCSAPSPACVGLTPAFFLQVVSGAIGNPALLLASRSFWMERGQSVSQHWHSTVFPAVIGEGCTKPLSWKWELAQVLAVLPGRIFRTRFRQWRWCGCTQTAHSRSSDFERTMLSASGLSKKFFSMSRMWIVNLFIDFAV